MIDKSMQAHTLLPTVRSSLIRPRIWQTRAGAKSLIFNFRHFSLNYKGVFVKLEKAPTAPDSKGYLKFRIQGNLCANETLCTNETNIKLHIFQIRDFITMVFDLK